MKPDNNTPTPFTSPTYEQIAQRAYRLWELEGRREGRALHHWLLAEQVMIAERKYEARTAARREREAEAPAVCTMSGLEGASRKIRTLRVHPRRREAVLV